MEKALQKKVIHLMEVVIDGKYRRANEPIRIELNGSCGFFSLPGSRDVDARK